MPDLRCLLDLGLHIDKHYTHITRPRRTAIPCPSVATKLCFPSPFHLRLYSSQLTKCGLGCNKGYILTEQISYGLADKVITRKVAINNALSLKGDRRDAIAKLKSWGFEFELQTNPMQFHLDSAWGATLMRLERVRWTRNGTEY